MWGAGGWPSMCRGQHRTGEVGTFTLIRFRQQSHVESIMDYRVQQGWPVLVLEGHCLACFSNHYRPDPSVQRWAGLVGKQAGQWFSRTTPGYSWCTASDLVTPHKSTVQLTTSQLLTLWEQKLRTFWTAMTNVPTQSCLHIYTHLGHYMNITS